MPNEIISLRKQWTLGDKFMGVSEWVALQINVKIYSFLNPFCITQAKIEANVK